MVVKPSVTTKAKLHCISVRGDQLWSSCNDSMKNCQKMGTFKEDIIKRYKAVKYINHELCLYLVMCLTFC